MKYRVKWYKKSDPMVNGQGEDTLSKEEEEAIVVIFNELYPGFAHCCEMAEENEEKTDESSLG